MSVKQEVFDLATQQEKQSRAQASTRDAGPFLKWAGGKTQLLTQLQGHFPLELVDGGISKFIEPFVGGGAVFFFMAQHYPFAEIHLYDINPELILTYQVVKQCPDKLISCLQEMVSAYVKLDADNRKAYFYAKRACYNAHKPTFDFSRFSDAWVERAALMIFLNKTCFNGLYRLNKSGLFNVPFGAHAKPSVFDPDNLIKASSVLSRCKLHVGSYFDCEPVVDSKSFIYFDPPYRPISKTASFNSYTHSNFGDDEQVGLAKFFTKMDKERGAKLMLSNSDPQCINPADNFFVKLYGDYHIHRASATRMINSKASNRGVISELIITNY